MGIIKKAVITEKYAAQNEKGKYTFIVERHANKLEVKSAIEKEYNVNVENVNTQVFAGKKKTKQTKTKVLSGSTSSYKKAIITVAKGEVIDIYSGI